MTSRELLNELLKAPGWEPQLVHPAAADAQAADGAAGPNREGDGPLDRERFEIDWGHGHRLAEAHPGLRQRGGAHLGNILIRKAIVVVSSRQPG